MEEAAALMGPALVNAFQSFFLNMLQLTNGRLAPGTMLPPILAATAADYYNNTNDNNSITNAPSPVNQGINTDTADAMCLLQQQRLFDHNEDSESDSSESKSSRDDNDDSAVIR